MKNILISQPTSHPAFLSGPYLYACLKTYSEKFDHIKNEFNWLSPIHIFNTVEKMLLSYKDDQIDILGLSCYCWTTELNYEIARVVKKKNPKCLIVAGGPDCTYKDLEYFDKYPFIDIVVINDGELTFKLILEKIIQNSNDFKDIPGLFILDENNNPHYTNSSSPFTDFELSPYIAQADFFDKIINECSYSTVVVPIETNRGCPYRCTFCDWGSRTMSKIRQYPIERINQEIEWISKRKVHSIHVLDANFGILPRDIDITKKLLEESYNSDYLGLILYTCAKNNADRTVEIARLLYEGELTDQHTIGMQHNDNEVLALLDRKNMKSDQQYKVISGLRKIKLPMLVQYILGCPGDTPEKWLRGLTDLMMMGIHEEYRVYLFFLLPNAPASNPEYLEKTGIKTISRIANTMNRPDAFTSEEYFYKGKVVVETNSFSKKDWLDMYFIDTVVETFHNGAFTRFIAMYLRNTHSISYYSFYKSLIEFIKTEKNYLNELYHDCRKSKKNFLYNEDGTQEIVINEVASFITCHAHEYMMMKIAMNWEIVWKLLETHLEKQYGYIKNLKSIMNWQKELIILPSYDRRIGKIIETDFNWIKYFEEVDDEIGFIEEPDKFNVLQSFKIIDTGCGTYAEYELDWLEKATDLKVQLRIYVDRVINYEYHRCKTTFFQKIELIEKEK